MAAGTGTTAGGGVDRGVRSEDEDFDADTPPDALVGSATASSGHDEPAALLLEMISATTRLAVLLAEADEDSFRALSPRRNALLHLVAQLPSAPQPRRQIGFRVARGTGKKTTKGKQAKQRGKK